MNWYYAKNGSQHGPISVEALKDKIASGEVAPSDLAWREGLADWSPVSTIAELKVEAASAVTPAAPGASASAGPVATASPYTPPAAAAPSYPSYGTGDPGTPIPNYLWQSIVVTILCCWPLGIPAIVFAAKVDGLKSRGDIAAPKEASDKAKMWTWIAFGCGLLVGIIYGVIAGIGAFSAASEQQRHSANPPPFELPSR